MTDTLIKENDLCANVISRTVYAKDVTQVCKSTGLDPIEIVHNFYGISPDSQVFNLASITVSETAIDSRIGTLKFGVYDNSGTYVNIMDFTPEGVGVYGNIDIIGGSTQFSTNSIEVLDKKVVLANTATLASHLDGGGIVLGTADSGTKTILYEIDSGTWDFSTGIRIPSGTSFSIGTGLTPGAVFNESGVVIGGVSMGAGSLILSPDISLSDSGLIIGDVSIAVATGITLGTDIQIDTSGISLGSTTANPVSITPTGIQLGSTNPVIIDSSGISLGTNISLTSMDGLLIGTSVQINETDGLILGTGVNAVSLSTTGLIVGDSFEITPTGGLSIAGICTINNNGLTVGATGSDQIFLNPIDGLVIGQQLSLSATSGLLLGDSISLTEANGILMTNPTTLDELKINTDGITIADMSLSVLNGLTIVSAGIALDSTGLTMQDVKIDSTGIVLSTDLSLTTATGLKISDITLNNLGLTTPNLSLTDANGLKISNNVNLTSSGLSLGTTNPTVLNSSTLSIGTSISMTEANGLVLSGANDSKITLGSTVQGIYTNTDLSLNNGSTILDSSLKLGSNMQISTSAITIGPSLNTVLDKTSLSFLSGTTVLNTNSLTTTTVTATSTLNIGNVQLKDIDGIHLPSTTSIHFGASDEWRIRYNSTTQNLLFEFYDSTSSNYIVKLELRNSS
jgi:hypothetical protein